MEPLSAGLILAGRFRLIRALGQGAAADVWLAEDTAAHRQVALKIPRSDSTDPAVATRLLRTGFEQGRRLVHPSIVRLHEMVEGAPPFVVMQYVEGASIGTLRGRSFRAIVAALIPLSDALEYAHRQGVVHRDLKASNVLCDPQGHCLLADFGLGAATTGGTLPAMSPQQLDGAAPAVSDDVYGFGALLYDLLSGAPPFHPQVTAERIRGEMPEIPATDLAGETIPEPLRRLAGSMLQKAPAQRPPGMAAVRDALEEVLREHPAPVAAEAGVIRPLERVRRTESAPGAPAVATAAPAPPARARRGLPAAVVYGGLAFCGVLALAVVLYLPSLVRERGPLVALTQPEPATASAGAQTKPSPPAAGSGPAPAPVPQATLDEALAAVLRGDDELRKLNAERWGGADWTEFRRLAQEGDAAYQRRDSTTALADYRAAAALGTKLAARADDVFAGALREGGAALAAGDQARAIAQFQTALAVRSGDGRAQAGLERARKLDQVLARMREASAAEAAGQRAQALELYRKAAALDPAWTAATEGVARLGAAAARDLYESRMAQGFAAQARGDLGAARAAFGAALQARPGDAQAASALAQIDADRNLERLASLQAEARDLERQERWADAVGRYDAALAADANLADAKQGRERAQARLELDESLRRELGNADRFNDDAVLRRASAVLDAARQVVEPGPRLLKQADELERLLQVARTPVQVTLQSDNLTEVTVFKVGRLGAFSNRTLDLRPGAYTAVGSRPGYRDVRLSFRVGPQGVAGPVVVRCEEPI